MLPIELFFQNLDAICVLSKVVHRRISTDDLQASSGLRPVDTNELRTSRTMDRSAHVCGQVGHGKVRTWPSPTICRGQVGPSAVDRSDHIVDESAHELLLGLIMDRPTHMYVDDRPMKNY